MNICERGENEAAPCKARSAMSRWAKPAHKAAARMVGYALTLGDADGFADLSELLALRLSDEERVGLAYAALRSLTPGDAAVVSQAAMGAA